MNLNLPAYRNSFHPAWYLLLLAPVAGVSALVLDLNGVSLPSLVARWLLAVAVLLPLAWWRDAEAPAAIRQWMKELRQQLPGFLLAFVVPGLVAVAFMSGGPVSGDEQFWVRGICLSGCLLMAATAFGAEFEQGTMAGFLIQPRTRSALFRQKMGSLAVLIAVAVLNLGLIVAPMVGSGSGNPASLGWDFLWPMLAILTTTPFFSLITRSTLAGAIFTIAVPLLLVLAGTLMDSIGSRLVGYPMAYAIPSALREPWIYLGIYFGAGAWLGWRQFARLEVCGGAEGVAHSGFNPLGVPTDRLLRAILPDGPLVGLVRKELRLHVVPWFVALIMVALWVLRGATRALATDADLVASLSETQGPVILAGMMGLLILIVSGSACVAEERQLGTLDWQLTQPLTLKRQWWVKLAVAFGLALVMGIGLPAMLLLISHGRDLFPGWPDSDWKLPLAIYGAVALGIHGMAVYASSFSRNTMKATAAGFCVLLVPIGLFMKVRMESILMEMTSRAEQVRIASPAWVPGQDLMVQLTVGSVAALVVVFLATLLRFGFSNFRASVVSRSAVARQFMVLALVVILPTLVLSEGIFRLAALSYQDSVATEQARRLDQAAGELLPILRMQWEKGAVDPEMLKRFGLPDNAPAEAITDSILGQSSPQEVEYWVATLTRWKLAVGSTNRGAGAGSQQDYYRLDPMLARRYGLTPAGPKVGAESVNPSGATGPGSPPSFYQMDPVLARRYGLIPAGPKTNAGPVAEPPKAPR